MSNDLIARLRDWSDGPDTDKLCQEAADEIERLRAAVLGHETNCMTKAREIEALRADAERYRWVRSLSRADMDMSGVELPWYEAGLEKLDDAIDAAMQSGKAVTP